MSSQLRNILFPFGILFLVILSNCGDVLEDNISNDEVFLRAPGNGVTLDSATVTFWWDHVEGAIDYQIQVVSPSFDSAQYFIADSFLVENQVTFTLGVGEFEWAVRALNNGYETDFFTSSFTVSEAAVEDTTDIDISAETIVLNTPLDEASFVEGNIIFWWEEISDANTYDIQIARPNFATPEELVYDSALEVSTLTLSLLAGEYEWRVRGVNDDFETSYTTYSLTVTEPVAEENPTITLVSPVDDYRTNEQSVTFNWSFTEEVDFYVLRISGPTDLDFVTESEQLSVSFDANSGDYDWSVTGVNSTDNINYYSDTLNFSYTDGIPGTPELTSPTAGESVSLPFQLTWNRQLDNIVRDSVFIYGADTLITGFPVGVQAENYLLQGLGSGDYEWSVKSVDNQGLESLESTKSGFTVQ